MQLVIIGAGAMGSLLGFYLSRHAAVTLLDPWAEHVAAINQAGIICEQAGAEATAPCQATNDPAAIGSCDAIIVMVKAAQNPWAAAMISRIDAGGRTNDALIYTLQNGVGNRELLAEQFGTERIGQGVSSLGATLLGPGRVRHAGMGVTVFARNPAADRAAAMVALFNQSGLPAELSDDLEGLIWGKLMANVAINALTALLRVSNGTLAEVPAARELAAAAVAEAAAVAAARGTRLPHADPVAHALEVAAATGANRSSMLQDVLRGAPTEIETINGAVCRAGRHHGVPTPVNDLLVALVQALDATHAQRIRS